MIMKSAELRVMAHMTNPPKPIGFDVIVDERTVATIDFDTVKKAHDQFVAMVAIREQKVP